MIDRPARSPTRLKYVMWDGTDPVDSVRLANRLSTSFRSINLLDSSPAGEFGVLSTPRVFEPCGPAGTDVSDALWQRGMFEFPRAFFSPTHHNPAGELPAILQFSGHGIPGFMFSESGVLIAMSRAMTRTSTTPLVWNFVNDNWNNPSTKVAIFSACRQLSGRVQQFHWSERMRGAANRVHIILGYRNTAPAAGTSAVINDSFVTGLAGGQTFITAWRNAHGGGLRRRWAALAFSSSVGDRLDRWVRSGSLPAEPAAAEQVLYFDEDNTSGRAVTRPTPDFSMDMEFVLSARPTVPALSRGDTVPPWTVFQRGSVVNLRLSFITDTFNDGDRLWIGALQVRPDYAGPFNIVPLIQSAVHAPLVARGEVRVLGRLHDETVGYTADSYNNVYEFTINRASMTFATIDATFRQLTIPMVILDRPNDHLSIYYLMVRLERGSREFGVPTDLDAARGIRIANQSRLIDEPQFCVFTLIGHPP